MSKTKNTQAQVIEAGLEEMRWYGRAITGVNANAGECVEIIDVNWGENSVERFHITRSLLDDEPYDGVLKTAMRMFSNRPDIGLQERAKGTFLRKHRSYRHFLEGWGFNRIVNYRIWEEDGRPFEEAAVRRIETVDDAELAWACKSVYCTLSVTERLGTWIQHEGPCYEGPAYWADESSLSEERWCKEFRDYIGFNEALRQYPLNEEEMYEQFGASDSDRAFLLQMGGGFAWELEARDGDFPPVPVVPSFRE